VAPIDAHGFGFGIKGLASVTLNNALVLRSIRIIKDREGKLTVAYPAQMGRDKTWYDVVEPKSESLRDEIDRRVLAEYRQVVDEMEAAGKAEEEPASEAPAFADETFSEEAPRLAEVRRAAAENPTGEPESPPA
jgi:DNA-binding cell septation regulator SpoVG